MAFLARDELERLGLGSVGENVLVSDKASIYGAERIRLGSNVRIDDFCILSAGEGGILVGDHVHIAAYSSIIGKGRVTIGDFANISSRVSIYSSSDDYSGATMTNPTVPEKFKAVDHRPVTIGRHVIIGSGSVVLPGLTLDEGAAVGALSLVNRDCARFGVYAGSPAKRIGDRDEGLLSKENDFRRRS